MAAALVVAGLCLAALLWSIGGTAPASASVEPNWAAQPSGVTAQVSATQAYSSYLPLVFRNSAQILEPNDPMYLAGQQWGLEQVNAPQGWYVSTGHAVTVAVVDSGVDLDHPDLVDSLWVNADEIPGNGIDDDSNGCVDDVHGYDYVDDNGVPDDVHGHGTHVAGIVGATTDNGLGMAGMSWGSTVMAIRVLDETGEGSVWAVAQGIRYAVDQGAQVINMSLGACNLDMQEMRDAVTYAQDAGVLLVAAAGNTYGSCAFYPAAYEGVIGVAATDSNDQRASFSTYGSHVYVAAPGVGIQSTTIGGGYGSKNGTSMATPMVSGLAAMLWTYCPGSAPSQIAQAIADGAVDLGAAGWDPYYGWGRIDASSMTCPVSTTATSLLSTAESDVSVQASLAPFRPGEVIVSLERGTSLQSLGRWQVLDVSDRGTSYLIRVP
ncbi:MAG: S8 family peptidase, partial [Anaerolineae bacterium]